MIEKPPVVMLTAAGWDFLRQRHQILATFFAEAGHRVVFVEGISGSYDYASAKYYARILRKLVRLAGRKISRKRKGDGRDGRLPANLSIYECAVAPIHPTAFRKVNELVFAPKAARDISELAGEKPIVWNFQPTTTAMQIAARLDTSLLIYDCVANFGEVEGMPPDISQTEREWTLKADLVFADSTFLVEKHASVRDDVIQLPPGVDFELFSRARTAGEGFQTTEKVCFFGGMGGGWFDFELASRVADAGYEVSLIGWTSTEHPLFEHENVRYLPSVTQSSLPELISASDAIILPYKLNEFTKGVFPSKAYECLATGKPVVATPLPDFRAKLSESMYLAEDAQGFIEVLRKLPETETPERASRRMEVARANSWKGRFESVERVLEKKWEEKLYD